MMRYECAIEDGTVYVDVDVGRLEVGPLSDVLNRFGEEHTVEYDEWEKRRYGVSFGDEGMAMDVRQTLETMTLTQGMVDALRDKPLEATSEDSFFESGRMALFTGFLHHDLEHGPV